MRFVGFAVLIACTWWPALGAAQNAADIDKIADMMVRLCVGGGHTEATSATGTGGADLSLRSLDVKGNLQGEFKISKSSAEGLANGLDNALSQVRGRSGRQGACVPATGSGAATGRHASEEAGVGGSDGNRTRRCGRRRRCERFADHD